jgi:E3 ubiquitin-protein ligase MARCH5
VLCGGLFLPTIAAIVGRVFFDSINNNVQRTLVGGIAFIAVKGVLKIYFKQKQYVRKQQRKILDYTDENLSKYGAQAAAATNRQQQLLDEDMME